MIVSLKWVFFYFSLSSGWSFCYYSRSIWSIWRMVKFWKLCRCWEESWLHSNTTRIESTCSAGTKHDTHMHVNILAVVNNYTQFLCLEHFFFVIAKNVLLLYRVCTIKKIDGLFWFAVCFQGIWCAAMLRIWRQRLNGREKALDHDVDYWTSSRVSIQTHLFTQIYMWGHFTLCLTLGYHHYKPCF